MKTVSDYEMAINDVLADIGILADTSCSTVEAIAKSVAALASPAEVVEPFGWTSRHENEGEVHRKWARNREGVNHGDGYLAQALYLHPPQQEPALLREALESIARNTCCDGCQEAALVARAALAEDGL